MLGDFYISERMFAAADRKGLGYLTLEDYLAYNHILQHGKQKERDLLTFRMLDTDKSGFVTLKNLQEFWKNITKMYCELFDNENLKFDSSIVKESFQEIVGPVQK